MPILIIFLMVVHTLISLYVWYGRGTANFLRQLADPLSAGVLETIAMLWLPSMVGFCLYLWRRRRKIGLKEFERTLLILFFLTIVFVFAFLNLYDPNAPSAAAILSGAGFATLGWVFSAYEARNNAKKAHTLTTLLQMRNSADLNKHRQIITLHLGRHDTLSLEIIAQAQKTIDAGTATEKPNLLQSLRFVANYFEFICAGYLTRDLDESLLMRSLRSILIYFSDWAKPFLEDERIVDGKYNPLIYRNMELAQEELRRKRSKELSRLAKAKDVMKTKALLESKTGQKLDFET